MLGCAFRSMALSMASTFPAVNSVINHSDNLNPWMLALAATKCNKYYHEEFLKYTEDPSTTDVFKILFSKYPKIPATLKVSCHAKLLSIECDTQLFPSCDLSSNEGNQEIINSDRPTASDPEGVENAFGKPYKQLTGKDYHNSTNTQKSQANEVLSGGTSA